MKIVDEVRYWTIGEVAKEIGRGAQTIKNWYQWQEQEGLDILPPIYYFDQKKTRYFKESDITKLKEFRDSIKYGMMAEINREKWGARGKTQESEVQE